MTKAMIVRIDRPDERQTKHSEGEVKILKTDGATALVIRAGARSRHNAFWIGFDRLEILD